MSTVEGLALQSKVANGDSLVEREAPGIVKVALHYKARMMMYGSMPPGKVEDMHRNSQRSSSD